MSGLATSIAHAGSGFSMGKRKKAKWKARAVLDLLKTIKWG
jgi:hypothetical protein